MEARNSSLNSLISLISLISFAFRIGLEGQATSVRIASIEKQFFCNIAPPEFASEPIFVPRIGTTKYLQMFTDINRYLRLEQIEYIVKH